ncbi:MAG: T9SS type A sorting domain-containing protein [bacterium]
MFAPLRLRLATCGTFVAMLLTPGSLLGGEDYSGGMKEGACQRETGFQKTEERIEVAFDTAGWRMARHQRKVMHLRLMGKTDQEIQEYFTQNIHGAKPAGTGAISGTVYFPEGAQVNGTIYVYNEYGNYIGGEHFSYVSNTYIVTNLASGSYYVHCSTYGDYLAEYYDDAFHWKDATLVAVTDGATTSGIDFTLDPGGTIEGTLFEEDGATPISMTSFIYKIYHADFYDYHRYANILGFEGTSEAGAYSISGLPPGNYKLLVGEVAGHMAEFYGDAKTWEEATPITVSTIEDTISNINFALERAGTIEVMFVDTGGRPLNFSGFSSRGLLDTETLKTLDFSEYGIDHSWEPGVLHFTAPAGSYYLWLRPHNGDQYVGVYYDNALYVEDATPIPVVNGDTTLVNFTVEKGGSISGYILVPRCNQIAFLQFLLYREKTSGQFEHFEMEYIDCRSGPYFIEGVPTGTYKVEVSLDRWAVKYYDDAYTLKEATPVQVTAPGETDGIDFVINPAISGTIFDSTGATPLSNCNVRAYDAETKELAGETGTDASGRYILTNLSGDYKIYAYSYDDPYLVGEYFDGTQDWDSAALIAASAQTEVTGIDFKLDRGGIVQGYIETAGERICTDSIYVSVVAYDMPTGRSCGFDNNSFNGGFEIEHLPAGSYLIAVHVPSYSSLNSVYYGGGPFYNDPDNLPVEVFVGEVTSDIVLTVGSVPGVLTVNVYDADTGELADFSGGVLVYDKTGHMVKSGWQYDSHEIGKCTVRGLNPGDYFVRTWMSDSPWYPWFEDCVDQWYGGVPVEGEGIYDWFVDIPDGAVPIAVSEDTVNIDFFLYSGHTTGVPQDDEGASSVPRTFALSQNYPNPFNPTTSIQYSVISDQSPPHVILKIYNILGQKVRTLVNEQKETGYYTVTWDGKDLFRKDVASGVYFYQLTVDERYWSQTKRMVLLR